jgi:hypothetical protein
MTCWSVSILLWLITPRLFLWPYSSRQKSCRPLLMSSFSLLGCLPKLPRCLSMTFRCDMSWFSACKAESLRVRLSLKDFRSGSTRSERVDLHGFAVVHVHAVLIWCRRVITVVVLCEKNWCSLRRNQFDQSDLLIDIRLCLESLGLATLLQSLALALTRE